MPMIVQHYRKIKTGAGLRNVAAHNERQKVYDDDGKLLDNPQLVGKWLHPEHQTENLHTHKDEKSSVLERRSETIKLANLSRKPQKNAAYAIEANFSFSPDFCSDWATNPESMKAIKAYFSGCNKFLKERFGPENVLQLDAHFDEKTPHLHALLVPIMTNAKGEKVYSSSSFLGGRAGLKKLQDDFAKEIGAKFGLERGVEGSKARHTDQAEWSAELKAKEKDLVKRERDVSRREKVLDKAVELWKNKVDTGDFQVGAQLGEVLHSLTKPQVNECWKVMKGHADDLRKQNEKKPLENGPEKSRGKGR